MVFDPPLRQLSTYSRHLPRRPGCGSFDSNRLRTLSFALTQRPIDRFGCFPHCSPCRARGALRRQRGPLPVLNTCTLIEPAQVVADVTVAGSCSG